MTVVRSAPHAEVLEHARAVVTHGGHGTVMKALAAGVPMVVMPHGRDQKDNGVRVKARGAAGLVVPRNASSRRVAAAVRTVLDDGSCREGARALGEVVVRDASADDLVGALENLPRPARHGHRV